MMNERTKPMSASASIRANPKNIVVRVSPAVSGWRAIASIALEKTNPTPTPGPIAASPYTSPWASAVSPSSVTPSWARIMTPSMRFSPPLRLSGAGFHPFGFVLRFLMRRYFVVFFSMPVNGFGDVERRQQSEDVGLNADDQELEKDEHRCQQRRQNSQRQRNLRRNKVRAEQEEDRQQYVSGHHVRKKSNGERKWPNDEHREELDRRQHYVDGPRNTRGEQRVLEVSEALSLESDEDEDDISEQRQEGRDRHARGHREVDSGDDL